VPEDAPGLGADAQGRKGRGKGQVRGFDPLVGQDALAMLMRPAGGCREGRFLSNLLRREGKGRVKRKTRFLDKNGQPRGDAWWIGGIDRDSFGLGREILFPLRRPM